MDHLLPLFVNYVIRDQYGKPMMLRGRFYFLGIPHFCICMRKLCVGYPISGSWDRYRCQEHIQRPLSFTGQ